MNELINQQTYLGGIIFFTWCHAVIFVGLIPVYYVGGAKKTGANLAFFVALWDAIFVGTSCCLKTKYGDIMCTENIAGI